MEIEKNYSILKACRFCPMCKHLCSSGNLSMHESDYPRGRGLLIYDVYRGAQWNSSYVNAIYNCQMCGCCLAGCEGGFDLPELIRSAREDIVKASKEPDFVKLLKDKLLSTGNSYGKDPCTSFTKKFTSNITGMPGTGDGHETLPELFSCEDIKNSKFYYPFDDSSKKPDCLFITGQAANYEHQEIAAAATSVFNGLNISFTLMPEEPDCGKILSILGYEDEAKKAAGMFYGKTLNSRAKYIVTSDPVIFDCLLNDFKRWGLNYRGLKEILYFSEYLEKVIDEKHVKFKKFAGTVSVVDSEYLCKKNNRCKSCRNIVKAVSKNNYKELDFPSKEAFTTGETAFCENGSAFTGGRILGRRIIDEALRLGIKTLITLSAAAKDNLLSSADKNIAVFDISEFVLNSL